MITLVSIHGCLQAEWTGPRCETSLFCDRAQCNYSGTCIEMNTGQTCVCERGKNLWQQNCCKSCISSIVFYFEILHFLNIFVYARTLVKIQISVPHLLLIRISEAFGCWIIWKNVMRIISDLPYISFYNLKKKRKKDTKLLLQSPFSYTEYLKLKSLPQ